MPTEHGVSAGLEGLKWPRQSARLVIRRPRPDDIPVVNVFRQRADVALWLANDEHQEWQPNETSLVAERDGQVLATGMVSLKDGWAQSDVAAQARNSEAEVGWSVDPAHAGQGIGTEFARELLQIAFDLGVRRVTAGCFADNVASWRIMEKVSMRREGHYVEESLHRSGKWLDGYEYAILDKEFHQGWRPPTSS